MWIHFYTYLIWNKVILKHLAAIYQPIVHVNFVVPSSSALCTVNFQVQTQVTVRSVNNLTLKQLLYWTTFRCPAHYSVFSNAVVYPNFVAVQIRNFEERVKQVWQLSWWRSRQCVRRPRRRDR